MGGCIYDVAGIFTLKVASATCASNVEVPFTYDTSTQTVQMNIVAARYLFGDEYLMRTSVSTVISADLHMRALESFVLHDVKVVVFAPDGEAHVVTINAVITRAGNNLFGVDGIKKLPFLVRFTDTVSKPCANIPPAWLA